MPLATNADMLTRYDARLIGDLIRDDDTRSADPASSTTLTAIVGDASAIVKAAVEASGRYAAEDVASLETAADPVLKRLTCDIALGLTYARRGGGIPDAHQQMIDSARDELERIRTGKAVLNLDAARASSRPESVRPDRIAAKANWPMSGSRLFPDRPPASET